MAKKRGAINWTMLPGYPTLTLAGNDDRIEAKYSASEADLTTIPPDWSRFPAAGYPAIFDREDLRLSEVQIVPHKGGAKQLYEITLIYSVPVYTMSEDEVMQEVEKDSQDVEVALAKHASYRTCWDHTLAAQAAGPVPAWWGTATSTVLATEQYIWLRPGDPPPDGYMIIAAETKPGVTGFLSGVAVVRETKRSRNQNKLSRETRNDYKIQDPPDDFNVPGDWLRGGSSIRRDGKLWVLTVQYTNSKLIDRDLYDEA